MSSLGQKNPQPGAGIGLRNIIKNSAIYSVSDVVLKVIGFFLIPIYTRALSPEEYGIIGYTAAIIQMLTPIAGLGLIGSLPILYHAYDGLERKRLISSVVNFTFVYSLLVTLVFILWGRVTFTTLGSQVPFEPYILLALWTLFFTTFFYLPLGILNMEERSVHYGLYSLGLSLINVATSVVLVVIFKMGALGVLWGGAVSGAIGMVVALVIIRDSYLPVIQWSKLKLIFVLALPTLPHLMSSTLWRFVDRLFLAEQLTLSVSGTYAVATTISSVALIVLGGASTALNPVFFQRVYRQDPALRVDWARLCSLFTLLAALVGLGLALLGPELVRFLTPPKYHDAIPLLPTLVLGHILTGLYWMASPGLGYTRKTWVYPVASLPAAGINLLLNAYLVPRFGAFGAAWAMVSAAGIQFVMCISFSQYFFRVPYEFRQIGKVLVLSVGIFAASGLLTGLSFWFTVMGKVLLISLLPIGLTLVRFFAPTELDAARSFVAKIRPNLLFRTRR